MASYAFATLQARQALQELWEQGKTVKDMAVALDVPLSTLYTELNHLICIICVYVFMIRMEM